MIDPRATAIDELPDIGEAAICMGVFDGVHRGHLALVGATVSAARERGVRAVALVFDPHPDEVIRPGHRVPRLAPLHENLRRLSDAGIDAPVPLRFDDELRALTAEQFLLVMSPDIRVKVLVMTPESAFGRDRAGTPEAMEAFGTSAGFELRRVERLATPDQQPISSARIRRLLAEGAMEDAVELLGHPAFLEGTPHPIGGSLELAYHAALPAVGRYRARMRAGSPADVTLTIGPDGRIALVGEPIGGDRIALDVLARA